MPAIRRYYGGCDNGSVSPPGCLYSFHCVIGLSLKQQRCFVRWHLMNITTRYPAYAHMASHHGPHRTSAVSILCGAVRREKLLAHRGAFGDYPADTDASNSKA